MIIHKTDIAVGDERVTNPKATRFFSRHNVELQRLVGESLRHSTVKEQTIDQVQRMCFFSTTNVRGGVSGGGDRIQDLIVHLF